MVKVQSFKRPEWEPLPREDCQGVDHEMLVAEDGFALALLRFAPHTSIDEHPAAWPIDVYCLEGQSQASVGGQNVSICAGQRMRWPANIAHRRWTEDATMITLMVENPPTG